MNGQFINVYIEVMSKKIDELVKAEIMLTTRLTLAERLIAEMSSDKSKHEEEYQKLATAYETIINESKISPIDIPNPIKPLKKTEETNGEF